MVRKMFCDKCKKEMEYENPTKHPYFDSRGRMLDYCKSCHIFASKIEKKYNKKLQKLREDKDKELLDIKSKPWWKF